VVVVVKKNITKVMVYVTSRKESGILIEGEDLKVVNKAEEVMSTNTFPQTLVVSDIDKSNVIAVFRQWTYWKDETDRTKK